MSKSKKLSRIELDVVVSEILKKSEKLKDEKLRELYKDEINEIEKEFDLLKVKFDELDNEFKIKIEKLKELCKDKKISLGLSYISDLRDYKNNSCYNDRKSYYIRKIGNFDERNEVYNKLVLMGINSEINIEELINEFVNNIVNN
jgi:formate dehydrogenase maturation protein FdhE